MKINHENVVQELKRQNEDALHFVIDQYGGLIKSIVAQHLYQFRHVQDECIDDVLLAAWNHIGSFNEKTNSLKNWLAAISKYKAIDYKRKYLKLAEKQHAPDYNLESNQADDRQVLKKELSLETEALLDQLTPEDRKLFVDYYIDGKDTASLANELNVEKSAIHNRLSRGRKKLKGLRRIFGEQ
ncbi:sigma-70 family RNA polymerase sigma factor [Planococcus salinarum]|uniref:sigma-70 family RNA polymerase sigma factor n=1 Tax=Planococcus salinarum TaxID=622695 RepID=UPI000E3D0512|nr:sigma-70 family RNA polymerase sigma factor [Planococcus salinarum]TAA72679.1 sigma-70 family RNA polymerase sigma factor [Planococcus salinarum]